MLIGKLCLITVELPGVIFPRIRKAVENTSFDMYEDLIKATVSLGISSFPEDADSISSALARADRALYKSKHGGRNPVCTAVESRSVD